MLSPEDIERWPVMRRQVIRQAALAVLWRGPLLGLVMAVLVVGMVAGLSYYREGQTLDFGWFQVAGQAGAPVFPVFSRFWPFALMAVAFGMAFLVLVGIAGIVTVEVAYRRGRQSTERDDS